MTIEKEYFNQILPLGNTPGLRSMIAVAVPPMPSGPGAVVDLNLAFGPTGGAGHFYEITAENVPSGAAVHVAASSQPSYLCQPFSTVATDRASLQAGQTGACWPIYANQVLRGRLPQVMVDRTPTAPAGYPKGYAATLTHPNYLHFRASAGGTGMILRVRQASQIPGTPLGDPNSNGGMPAPF